MTKNRMALHNLLTDLLGSEHCYYQPPESVSLVYPCIVYHYDNNTRYAADDRPYALAHQFIVTLITKDPEDPVFYEMTMVPKMRFDRYYSSDNLHHYSFVYYDFNKETNNG